MPQTSYLYACARISCLENGLLGANAVRRMAESAPEDAMRVLTDARYGNMPDATINDLEKLIENELNRATAEIGEITPDKELTDLFLLPADIQNLKVLLKARYLPNAEIVWQDGGLYTRDTLEKTVKDQEYSSFPEEIGNGLNALEEKLKIAVDPQVISVSLDKAYAAHCLKVSNGRKDAFARSYFKAQCDFNNLLTFLRMRDIGAAKEEMKERLLPEGDIPVALLVTAYDQPLDTLPEAMKGHPAEVYLCSGLEEIARGGHIGALEKSRDDYLLSLVKSRKYDIDTIFPIIGYYLARQREAQAIRLIMTVKRNGLDDGVIAERLRELYG